MSHYVALVLLPAETKPSEYEAKVGKLIEPYNENTPVEPYEQACYCVGLAASREVDAEVDAKLGTIEQARTAFHAATLAVEDEKAEDRRWKAAIAPRVALRKSLLDVHPGAHLPDPGCSECSGTGKLMTTYNPASKWDWWVIGGRWSGYLEGGDVASVRKLIGRADDEWVPFAIVTPDGEWNEKGKMRWFAVVDNETDESEWVKQARALLAANLETVAVAVDLHI